MVALEHRTVLVYMARWRHSRHNASPETCLTNRDLVHRIWLEKNCRGTSSRNLYLQPNYIDLPRLLEPGLLGKETGKATRADRSQNRGRDTYTAIK